MQWQALRVRGITLILGLMLKETKNYPQCTGEDAETCGLSLASRSSASSEKPQ